MQAGFQTTGCSPTSATECVKPATLSHRHVSNNGVQPDICKKKDMIDGRTKGKAAERQVCEIVKAWWLPHEPTAKFRRTPSSGAWGSGDESEGFQAAADLMTTSKTFPFSIEIKRREGWNFSRFRDNKPSPVAGWWAQTRLEARTNGQIPMLWLRKSRMPWMVLLPEAFILSCWEREREKSRKLPPVVWSFRYHEALCFEATVLLKHPPDYFLAPIAA